ncbi:response regulator transcription factor [Streptomyces sp. NPDC002730]|uniref:response regulator transcription factor n=1 Tax=Streptomyces sp. NPDC002730 TaxID=3364662 RepID=UPI0036B48ABA
MTLRALLIEDDETIAEPLVEGLGRYGLTVGHVSTGAAGLQGPYGDIVLLDLGLPDMDGIDVCRGIRQVSDVPIIMLTARGTEADRVLGLELGADDYLAKPVSIRELIARIRAVTRRTAAWSGAATAAEAANGPGALPRAAVATPPATAPDWGLGASAWQDPEPSREPGRIAPQSSPTGALVVDRRTREVWIGERPIILTPKEFDLLALLAEDPGAVYSRQEILDRVWDLHFHGPTKTLDVHVATLRRKLGDPAWIQTLRGVGLRLAVRPRTDTNHPESQPR